MNEKKALASLVGALEKEMPGCVIFKHFDLVTSGIPDLSVTWCVRTLWIEGKYETPLKKAEHRPVQVTTMPRLAKCGLAYWVTFRETDRGQREVELENAATGHAQLIADFNYKAVAMFFRLLMWGLR